MLRYVPFLECATTGTDTGFPFITVVPESVPVCWADPLHANNKTKNINPITFIFSPFLPIAEWFKTRQTSKVPGSSKCGVWNAELKTPHLSLRIPHWKHGCVGSVGFSPNFPCIVCQHRRYLPRMNTNYTNGFIRAIRVIRG